MAYKAHCTASDANLHSFSDESAFQQMQKEGTCKVVAPALRHAPLRVWRITQCVGQI